MPGLNDYLRLVEPSRRSRWVMQVIFAGAMSLVEAVGALLVFQLLTTITGSKTGVSLPFIGQLQALFPGVPYGRLVDFVDLGIGVFFVVRALLLVGLSYSQNRLVYGAGVRLSDRLFTAYLDREYAWHLHRNSAELVRNAYESVAQIVGNVFIPFVAVAADGFLVVAILLVLLSRAPLAALLAVAVLAPVVFVLLKVLQSRYSEVGAVNLEMARQSLQVLQQGFAGTREIQVLGAAPYFAQRFERSQRRQAGALAQRAVMLDIPRPSVESLVILLLLGFLVYQRNSGRDTGGSLATLGLFAYAVLRLMPALNRIVANIGVVRFGAAAVAQVVADLEYQAPTSPAAAVEPLHLEHKLILDGVSFTYPERDVPALDNVNIAFLAGQSVGIVGATGCGKTTLLDVVCGLLTPQRGSVRVDSTDIVTNLAGWRNTLGLVPQTQFLVDDTLRRNIALGVEDDAIDAAALDEALHLARLDGFIATLPQGLDTVVGEAGVRLSGGQRQRVAIARALYRRPSVLILDEGTAALDNLTEAELVGELELLRGTRTILTVAHRLTTVRHCDVIVVMESGRVVDSGSWEDLAGRSPVFQRLVGSGG